MIPPSSVATLEHFSSRSRVAHRLPPRKKFRLTTTDDVLNQLAREAIDILSQHPLAPSTLPKSSSQLHLGAPESPDSFFKRAGIQISTPLHLQSGSLSSRKHLGCPPPPLPRPCSSNNKRPNLRDSPSAQPACRRLTPSEPLHTSHLLTPSTARAAQSLLELTQ